MPGDVALPLLGEEHFLTLPKKCVGSDPNQDFVGGFYLDLTLKFQFHKTSLTEGKSDNSPQ